VTPSRSCGLSSRRTFVVIGGVAAGAHGSGVGTIDLDVAYARERQNLERLAELLRSLGARLRGAPVGVPFQLDADGLEAGGDFTFTTKLGISTSLRIRGEPRNMRICEQQPR
jgi:hypothetical protein